MYSVLQEAEHRSVTPLPYWSLPFANLLVPRLRKFNVRDTTFDACGPSSFFRLTNDS